MGIRDVRILQSAAAAALLAVVMCGTFSQARFVQPGDNSVGGACRLQSGRHGQCRLITDCPSAMAAIRRTARQGQPSTHHQRCGFKGTIEIVCCERDSGAGGGNRNNQNTGGVRHPGNSNLGSRRPWRPGGGRPNQDSQWLPGGNRNVRPSGRPTAAQRVQNIANEACQVYTKRCPNNVRPYIIDGTVAGLGEIPHMAALGYRMKDNSLSWDCGGTLISDRYVMTAAHCTRMTNGKPVVVRLGDLDLALDDEGATPIDFTIEKIDTHPSYSSGTNYHDIALLRLGRSVNFTQFICPACLYTGGNSGVGRRGGFDLSGRMAGDEYREDASGNSFQEDSSGVTPDYELGTRLLSDGEEVGPRQNDENDLRDKSLFVSGWGSTSFPAGDKSPVLMLAKIQPFSTRECNVSLHEANGRSISLIPRGINPDAMLCAGDRNGKKDACLGDSGGPLQFQGRDSSSLLTVVGITSFGIKCGLSLPGVYTRVSSYVSWIERIAWPQGPPS